MASNNKKTTRVSRSVNTPAAPTTGIDNPAITDPASAAGSTAYADKKVVGGTTEIIINDIIVRAPQRIKQDISSWRNGLRAAESRYYPNRTRLYDIYSDIRLDAHLSGLINKRIATILNTPLMFVKKDNEELEGMDEVIRSIEFRKILREIMETQFWGITGLEFLPGETLTVRSIPRKHIKTKTQLISIEQNIQEEGFDYTRLDNVWVIGEAEDLGLLSGIAPLALYKRGALADWANFIEVFGQPTRVFKYDPFDKGTEDALRRIATDTGNMLAILVPKTADFDMKDGTGSNANGDLQAKYVTMLDQQMSIAVLGNTETTANSGTGSQAKSKTHQAEQREITRADLAYVQATLNSPHFLRILQSYGLPVEAGAHFVFKTEIDINYLAQRVVIDTTLKNAGLPIDADYFYKTYEIPQPKNPAAALPTDPGTSQEPAPDAPKPTQKKKQKPEDRAATIADVKAIFKDFFDLARS